QEIAANPRQRGCSPATEGRPTLRFESETTERRAEDRRVLPGWVPDASPPAPRLGPSVAQRTRTEQHLFGAGKVNLMQVAERLFEVLHKISLSLLHNLVPFGFQFFPQTA